MTASEQFRVATWAIVCAAIGGGIGQLAPSGLAAAGEVGSPIRNGSMMTYGAIGFVAGLVLGIMLVLVTRKPNK